MVFQMLNERSVKKQMKNKFTTRKKLVPRKLLWYRLRNSVLKLKQKKILAASGLLRIFPRNKNNNFFEKE